MTRTISAVYENGVIRPIEELNLDEGEHLDLLLITKKSPTAEMSRRAIEEIAAMPDEGDTTPFSGADHNEVLYPKG